MDERPWLYAAAISVIWKGGMYLSCATYIANGYADAERIAHAIASKEYPHYSDCNIQVAPVQVGQLEKLIYLLNGGR